MQNLPWIVAAAALVALGLVTAAWLLSLRQRNKKVPMPKEWAVVARPVFSTDERRAYRVLREALPHHVVLSKLPLVRFCQPSDPARVNFWFDLLGTKHVTFAVCSANGRMLAAIDLDTERGGDSRRTLLIKQSVLNACRVRYLRCPVDNMPSIAELQLLVPQASAGNRGPQAAPPAELTQARDTLASTVAHRRAERTALWNDSSVFQDSFFAPDSRQDSGTQSEFPTLHPPVRTGSVSSRARTDPQVIEDDDLDSVGGIVTDDDVPLVANSHR